MVETWFRWFEHVEIKLTGSIVKKVYHMKWIQITRGVEEDRQNL